MRKYLTIFLIYFFWSSNALSALATCMYGECEFELGLWYDYGETNCMQTMFMVKVDQQALGFTIEETGEYCMIFNEE